METIAVSSEQTFKLGNLDITPLVRKSIISMDLKGTVTFHVTKEPIVLIINSGQSKRAYRISGEEVSFETLNTEYPDLRSDPALKPVPE
jgi:hypothetical protein